MELTNFLAGDDDLVGNSLLDGIDDTLAGSDLGFLPMLASAIAPRLLSMATPMAANLLRSQAPAMARLVTGRRGRGLSHAMRIPRPMANRAIQSMASGAPPEKAFLEAMQAENDPSEILMKNPNNPTAPFLALAQKTLKGTDLSGSDSEELLGELKDIWEGIKTVFKSKDKANALSSPQRIAPAPTKRTIQQPVKNTSLLIPATQTSSTTTNAVKYPIRPIPDFTFSPDSPAWQNKADDIPDLTPKPKPEMKKFIAPAPNGAGSISQKMHNQQAEDVYPNQQTNSFADLDIWEGK